MINKSSFKSKYYDVISFCAINIALFMIFILDKTMYNITRTGSNAAILTIQYLRLVFLAVIYIAVILEAINIMKTLKFSSYKRLLVILFIVFVSCYLASELVKIITLHSDSETISIIFYYLSTTFQIIAVVLYGWYFVSRAFYRLRPYNVSKRIQEKLNISDLIFYPLNISLLLIFTIYKFEVSASIASTILLFVLLNNLWFGVINFLHYQNKHIKLQEWLNYE
ncbi:hypothetical protein [Mycoplasma phocoenae]|uniref:Uncharacterized protein n=1 Tax=Mycoplasma phocoenae TaxID=754517 RepID=A0A858U8J4_9MOLU|nr:hypothetical protein [Mycoplasma phocoenae]QJG67036.1 hypothetical protein HGG69_01740 [Mycoplasma phocoenae]